MPSRVSPNRRRSIAVLNQGTSARPQTHRRRAYSIVPGEKLSPAAKARRLLAPRKSILKSQDNTLESTQSSADFTQRLSRRVSFASHAHVRLFQIQDPNASITSDTGQQKSSGKRRSSAGTDYGEQDMDMDDQDFDGLDSDDFGLPSDDARGYGLSSSPGQPEEEEERAESSEVEEEEEGGEEDMDITLSLPRAARPSFTPLPAQSKGHNPRPSFAPVTTSFSQSENQGPKRVRPSFAPVRQSTEQGQGMESLYPSLEGLSVESSPTKAGQEGEEEDEMSVPGGYDPAEDDLTSMSMDLTTNSLPAPTEDLTLGIPLDDITTTSALDQDLTTTNLTTSSVGSEPMEFTIPLIRPAQPPDPVWLQLRAVTHSGGEPYVPEEDEEKDDEGANEIVKVDEGHWKRGGGGGDGDTEDLSEKRKGGQEEDGGSGENMDISEALSRLSKARVSLGLPPTPTRPTTSRPPRPSFAPVGMGKNGGHDEFGLGVGEDGEVEEGGMSFVTESSMMEESLDLSFDPMGMGDETVNVTKIRRSMSLGGRASGEELSEGLGDQEQQQQSAATVEKLQAQHSETVNDTAVPPAKLPARLPVFARPGQTVFSAPTSASLASSTTSTQPFVFSAPPKPTAPTVPSVFSKPPLPSSSRPSTIPKSPARPIRASVSPAKSPGRGGRGGRAATSTPTPRSPTKTPAKSPAKGKGVFRGTATFAPPSSVVKGPGKRMLEEVEEGGGVVKRARVASSESPAKTGMGTEVSVGAGGQVQGGRRVSGLFAQRRASLAASRGGGRVSLGARGVSGSQAQGQGQDVVLSTAEEEEEVEQNEREPELEDELGVVPREAPLIDQSDEDLGMGIEVNIAPPTPRPTSTSNPTGSPAPVSSPPPSISLSPTPSPAPPTSSSPSPGPSSIPTPTPTLGLGPFTSPSKTGPRRVSLAPPSVVQGLDQEKEIEGSQSQNLAARRVSFAPAGRPRASLVPGLRSTQLHEGLEREEEGGDEREDMDTWVGDVAYNDGEEAGEDDEPTISIEQFFTMTGVRFMDELTAPRRSTIHPSHLRPPNRRHRRSSSIPHNALSSSTSEDLPSTTTPDTKDSIPLAEYFTALSISVPQLKLYGDVSGELTAWIEECKKVVKSAEQEAVKVTPGLFREYAIADEEEKRMLVHQLKLIKAHNLGQAKSQWYEWKYDWVGQLQEEANVAFTGLEDDARTLESIISDAQSMLPGLRDEYAQILEELEKEQKDVEEIENADKEYLSELKGSIAEQDTEIQSFRAALSESSQKLTRLTEKLEEIEGQKREIGGAIQSARKEVERIEGASGGGGVARMRDQLEALEALHLWRPTRISPDLLSFIYANRFQVSIPCTHKRPDIQRVSVGQVKQSSTQSVRAIERDEFPEVTRLMVGCVKRVLRVEEGRKGWVGAKEIIEKLSDFWISLAQLRTQLTFLRIKWPLTLTLVSPSTPSSSSPDLDIFAQEKPPALKVTAVVLFLAAKSKAYISFIFDYDTYSRWPMSVGEVGVDVKVAYGKADREQIYEAVLGRMRDATPAVNHGCLLDSVMEALEAVSSVEV